MGWQDLLLRVSLVWTIGRLPDKLPRWDWGPISNSSHFPVWERVGWGNWADGLFCLCVLSAQKSAMRVVVCADRLTMQHSIVDISNWSWSYWQIWYPSWHVECFWHALVAHKISSVSHTSVLPQYPRWEIVPYRVGWNNHTIDYYG